MLISIHLSNCVVYSNDVLGFDFGAVIARNSVYIVSLESAIYSTLSEDQEYYNIIRKQ